MATPIANQPRISITGLVKLIRKTEQYEQWKRAVFIRDRFQCQECGKRNGRKRVIEAHHLIEFSQLVKDNGIQSVEQAVSCPELWEVSNGQTLCGDCHRQTDSYPKNFIDTKNSHASKKDSFSK
ncbi:HNH endonuclease [Spirosoma spitsbergense]|uniref:HNH endonuclease n=1 Tax=Spirosoma spitsbergense TaxID=431554 RepID=UPI003CCBCC8C